MVQFKRGAQRTSTSQDSSAQLSSLCPYYLLLVGQKFWLRRPLGAVLWDGFSLFFSVLDGVSFLKLWGISTDKHASAPPPTTHCPPPPTPTTALTAERASIPPLTGRRVRVRNLHRVVAASAAGGSGVNPAQQLNADKNLR